MILWIYLVNHNISGPTLLIKQYIDDLYMLASEEINSGLDYNPNKQLWKHNQRLKPSVNYFQPCS